MLAEVSPADWMVIGLLAVVILILLSVRMALARIESRLNQRVAATESVSPAPLEETNSEAGESAFEQFLAEDPQRLTLPKSEQFAAYREWRKDKGMTWSS